MIEFPFYNQLDPGAKGKKTPRYESRKMALKQAQEQTKKLKEHFRVAVT